MTHAERVAVIRQLNIVARNRAADPMTRAHARLAADRLVRERERRADMVRGVVLLLLLAAALFVFAFSMAPPL